MRRSRKVPAFLLVLLLGSLLVGPYVGTSSADIGESALTLVSQPIGVAATPGRVYFTQGGSCFVTVVDDRGQRTFVNLQTPSRPACVDAYLAVAGPKDPNGQGFPTPTLGGFPSNYLYVTQGRYVIEVTESGVISRDPFATIPATANCPSHTGITFDRVHSATVPAFRNNILVTCIGGTVWAINRDGATVDANGNPSPAPIASVAAALGLASVKIENPDVAPGGFGGYGGQAFVAAPDLDRIFAISRTGAVTRFARWPGAEGENFVPAVKCTFGTSTSTYFTAIYSSTTVAPGIYQFPLSVFQGRSGNAIVTSETNAGMGLMDTNNVKRFHENIGRHEGSAFVDCTVPRLVGLRVDPGSNAQRSINPFSSGTTAFAILSSPAFYPVRDIRDLSTITFGYTGNEPSLVPGSCDTASPRDVNGDGIGDLICRAYNNLLFFPQHLTSPPLNTSGVYSGRLIVKFDYIDNGAGQDPEGEGFD